MVSDVRWGQGGVVVGGQTLTEYNIRPPPPRLLMVADGASFLDMPRLHVSGWPM